MDLKAGIEKEMIKKFEETFFEQVQVSVEAVQVDERDPWPVGSENYEIIETLHKGRFSQVSWSQTNDSLIEGRKCIMKVVDYKQMLKSISNVNESAEDLDPLKSNEVRQRCLRLLKRTIMSLYVMGICRHENILHAHSIFFDQGKLNFVMPHFHVLEELINEYRSHSKDEPMSMKLIAPIIRQVCKALDFLQQVGIIHRDVRPCNILLTRNGTIKLTHFGQSRILKSSQHYDECRTPVGNQAFMCAEKMANLYADRQLECNEYDYSSDIWSLGVIVLSMVSYFPNERHHKLLEEFATVMKEQQATFLWLTADKVQLRARLIQSGGNELKNFLSDVLLHPNSQARPQASELMHDKQLLKWCHGSIDQDKVYLRKWLIEKVDFANRMKRLKDAMNFDCLECKNIPAEFYWSDEWKQHDSEVFIVSLSDQHKNNTISVFDLQFCKPEQIFAELYALFESEVILLADLLPIHKKICELTFNMIKRCAGYPTKDMTMIEEYTYNSCDPSEKKLHIKVGFGDTKDVSQMVDSFQGTSFY